MKTEFMFEPKNGRVTITGFSGRVNTIRIPESIDGMPVTAIGERGV
jgi:hypothetical protein